jgi:Mg2+/citrate symporter
MLLAADLFLGQIRFTGLVEQFHQQQRQPMPEMFGHSLHLMVAQLSLAH